MKSSSITYDFEIPVPVSNIAWKLPFLPSFPSNRKICACTRSARLYMHRGVHALARVPWQRRPASVWIRLFDMQSESNVVGDRGAGAATRLYYFPSHVNMTTADGHWIMYRITKTKAITLSKREREREREKDVRDIGKRSAFRSVPLTNPFWSLRLYTFVVTGCCIRGYFTWLSRADRTE